MAGSSFNEQERRRVLNLTIDRMKKTINDIEQETDWISISLNCHKLMWTSTVLAELTGRYACNEEVSK